MALPCSTGLTTVATFESRNLRFQPKSYHSLHRHLGKVFQQQQKREVPAKISLATVAEILTRRMVLLWWNKAFYDKSRTAQKLLKINYVLLFRIILFKFSKSASNHRLNKNSLFRLYFAIIVVDTL